MSELEMHLRLYYTGIPDYIEVAPDPDGLGGLVLRYRDENNQIRARIDVHDDQIDSLIRALQLAKRRADLLQGEVAIIPGDELPVPNRSEEP